MIGERQGQDIILDPGQSRILNGEETTGNHEQNKPHRGRIGEFALIHRSSELNLTATFIR
jgi:hypothetical protein